LRGGSRKTRLRSRRRPSVKPSAHKERPWQR
jgi:hypothetical protein